MKILVCFLAALLLGTGAYAQVQPETKTGSVVVGAPTGGNQGAGSINAQQLYVNGVAVTAGGVLPPQNAGTMLSNCGSTTASPTACASAQVFNVKDYGTGVANVCTGSSSDATAVNAALTAASAVANSTVYFPPGSVCTVAASLTVPSGVTLFAYPGTATLKVAATSTANPQLLSINGSSGNTIYGLILDGGLSGVPSLNNVNTVYNSSGVVFDHVTLQNTRGIPIVFSTNVQNSGVRGSTFTNVGNYWVTSGLNADQQQGVVFCCGTTISTSGSSATATLTFSATTGVTSGELAGGTNLTPGSYVVSTTSTTVTLNLAPITTVASATAITFSSNSGNFADDNYFTSTGLDAISATNQVDFRASRNHCSLPGGRSSNGGACLYASVGRGMKVLDNVSNNALGNGFDLINEDDFLIDGNTAYASASRGISVDTAANGVIARNHALDNQQVTTANGQGGINVSSWIKNVTVSGNDAHDDQALQTQPYGLGVTNGTTILNFIIGTDNLFSGNLSGEVGGGFGSEGAGAVDLQKAKNTMALGATGFQSLASGANVNSSGAWSAAIGEWDISSGEGSMAFGEFVDTRFRKELVFGSGQIVAIGDSQVGTHVLRGVSTSTTALRLTSDAGAAGTTNCVNLPNINFPTNQESVYGMSIRVVATDLTTVGSYYHFYEPAGTLYRSTNFASTTYAASASTITNSIGTAGSVAISADTTYGCLNITWTAPNTHTWHVVARVDTTESY